MAISKNSHPYSQIIKNDKIIRTFSKDTSSEEMKWHRDEKDRVVTVLNECQNWLFQMDGELPIELEKGSVLNIPAKTWHRIKKGTTDLVIEIIE